MVRPRSASHNTRAAGTHDDLSALSSEVLGLRLQALNLPITGSKAQLLARLRQALSGAASKPGSKPPQTRVQRRAKVTARPRRTRSRIVPARNVPFQSAEDANPLQGHADDEQEDSALHSDQESVRSLEEMLDPEQVVPPPQNSLSAAQRFAIEGIVAESVHNALDAFRSSTGAFNPSPVFQSPRTPGMASPLGLSRPVDRGLEDKILRGEYIDLALLLPDNMYQPQTPELQLRLDDSSLGPLGSPVTMVRKRKPVIDTFQKWLDAYMAYMLVIVAVHPRRALELIKYQQIISRAVTKFKGLAWLSYDQQFRRRAAYDLSISWDKVDLELWTITFSGLAKPHCTVRAPTTLKTSVLLLTPTGNLAESRPCASTSTRPPVAGVAAATTRTCAAAAIPAPTPHQPAHSSNPQAPAPPRPPPPASVARNKVEQQKRHLSPSVSSPIDIYRLELELAAHPDRPFVSDLLSSLKEGARIGYSGPRTSRVSPNLISAAQHPEVVSSNLQKEIALGRVAGPYPDAPLPDFQCHPVGVVPKKHSSEWRTIYHLSYPQGHSINDYIPKDSFSLTYVRVDDAIHILKTLGKGAFMAKTDLKSAFRLIPIHPEDWSLLGIYWQSQYYVDMYLPFGLRSAPFLFNQLSDGIEWILKHNYGLKHVIHILDDFFIAEHSKLACLALALCYGFSCHLRPQL